MAHLLKLSAALGMAVVIALIWGFIAGCRHVDEMVDLILDNDD